MHLSQLKYLKRVSITDLHFEDRSPFAYGGIGNLYKVEAKRALSETIHSGTRLLLKTLAHSYSSAEVDHYFANLDSLARTLGERRHHFFSRLAIPLAIVDNRVGKPIGFLMREFSQDCTCNLNFSQGPKTAVQEVKIFLNAKTERERLGTPLLSREDKLWLIGDFLKTLSMLHDRDICVGDLSHSNLIVQHHKSNMRILFLDVDSFSIGGLPHPLGLQTSPLYRAPEEKLNSMSSNGQAGDVFKAALLITRLLSQLENPSQHSFDTVGIMRCSQTLHDFGGNTLISLLARSLSPNPDLRPSIQLISKVWNDELDYQ